MAEVLYLFPKADDETDEEFQKRKAEFIAKVEESNRIAQVNKDRYELMMGRQVNATND